MIRGIISAINGRSPGAVFLEPMTACHAPVLTLEKFRIYGVSDKADMFPSRQI
ncbi:hypothetical protein C8N43_1417 [Litoreibacter ponti]|uniref:Uncharacterized protein n=1 Tax=Litoreibacter ponti TaxID=1510457 RepID=A0A2T6BL31_9RHOB|nr:hypothetical protein C8N43_1417 [Litoreibacter ponti]